MIVFSRELAFHFPATRATTSGIEQESSPVAVHERLPSLRPERLLQRPHLGGQRRHLLLQTRYTNGQRLAGRCPVTRVGGRLRINYSSAEGGRPTRLLLARTARQLADERGLV